MAQFMFALNLIIAGIGFGVGNVFVPLVNLAVAWLMWGVWRDQEKDKEN